MVTAELSNPERVERLLDAIRQVETGGHPDPANAIGDGGKSFGAYQISKPYWHDAWLYKDCPLPSRACVADEQCARETVRRYWQRWAPQNLRRGDLEHLARVHNGGPRGHLKKSTEAYWLKVKKELEEHK